MDERIAFARKVAQKIGIPNAESKPRYRVGKNSHHRRGLGLRRVDLGRASIDL